MPAVTWHRSLPHIYASKAGGAHLVQHRRRELLAAVLGAAHAQQDVDQVVGDAQVGGVQAIRQKQAVRIPDVAKLGQDGLRKDTREVGSVSVPCWQCQHHPELAAGAETPRGRFHGSGLQTCAAAHTTILTAARTDAAAALEQLPQGF